MNYENIKEVFQFYGCQNLIVFNTFDQKQITYWSTMKERIIADYLIKQFGKEMMIKFWCYQMKKNPKKVQIHSIQ